eukprot:gb/GFBE01053187.1/.p1 GENE.gb/GFBE01053187.1/~~gb/GFBE01053187.1/.p1  ORF type:complete len:685 (+),score=282.32 gb/GFBE01053187.1/:1-2055(+)
MKCQMLLLLVPTMAVAVEQRVTLESPVQKVVQMLNAMLDKGKKEVQEEKLQYATYSQWCEMTSAEKSASIEDATSKITMLSADIEKASTTANVIQKEIDGHSQQIEALTQEIAAAKEVREQELKDYSVSLKDYKESIDAISRATAHLKKQAYERKQAAEKSEEVEETTAPTKSNTKSQGFIQLSASLGDSTGAKEVQKLAAAQAPEVAGYEFQSGGILEMLDNLQTKFVQEKTELEKSEAAKRGSHELAVGGLQNELDSETKDRDRKAGLKSKKMEQKASMEDELSTTTDSKEADTKYLDDLTGTCQQKAADFESNQKLRQEEIEAVQKAVGIVSEKLSLIDMKWRASLLQVGKSALAYLRSKQEPQGTLKERVVEFLQGEATRIKSAALANLIQPATTAGAIGQIREMLQSLLVKLQEQAGEEATKKVWCDGELKTNEQTRSAKTGTVDELTADADRLEASIASLGEDIAAMKKDLVELDEAMTNATDIRNKEKTTNAATIEEAKKAQSAVEEAVMVLKEFYEKSGLGAALLQEQDSSFATQEQPTFGGAYTGMGDTAGGPIALLQTIAADFARLEADTSAEEHASDEEYNQFSSDFKLNKASKATDVKHLEQKKVEQNSTLVSKRSELESAETELDAANEYFEQLKPQCLDTHASFEAREAQRKEEIESLQKAFEMLNNVNV